MPPRDTSAESESEFSLTVARALQILISFSETRSELGISELARELGLPKASIQRNMRALEKYLFVEKNPETRKYRIGVQAYRLGRLFTYGRLLENHAEPLMRTLVEETGYTSYLALLKQGSMLIIASLEGSGPIRFTIPVGSVLPVNGTAVGKAALSALAANDLGNILKTIDLPPDQRAAFEAEIAQSRAQGYGIIAGEYFPGVGAVAAPIVGPDGKLIAVVSMGFAVSQVPAGKIPELGEQIRDVAQEIARRYAQDEEYWGRNDTRRTPARRGG